MKHSRRLVQIIKKFAMISDRPTSRGWAAPTAIASGLLGFALLGSALTSCTATSQTQAQSTNTPAMGTPHMGSGKPQAAGMDHHNMSMDLGPADADLDLRFIDAMIPHHQGAVVMAKAALENSQRPEMKALASEIIAAQDKEIAQMKQWRKDWYPQASDTPMMWHAEGNHMMPMSTDHMKAMSMDQDLGKADADFDLRFINGMVPHHDAAVVMAKDVLAKSKRPEIKQLAQAIIDSQQIEINQMQQWRKAWYQQ
ncbi:MAG: DUF305 domain-containing protein [Thermosynechococcaceae cyanobacterium]